MDIQLIPTLSDNYVYLFKDPQSDAVGIVDPGDPGPVLAALDRTGWCPTHIFNTHHHADHIGGNGVLKQRFGCTIIGPAADRGRIPELDVVVADEDTYHFGSHEVRVFETPGHTSGHVAFWFPDASALFSGDTLFALGCGRLFEGTPAQMWNSLLKLRELPADTRVYCGHEYTLSNARFAVSVDPGNPALKERAADIAVLRDAGKPTIPTTLGVERATNPFLRADDPDLAAELGLAGTDPVEVFAEIRRRKDHF
ncbi:hydroxyacylglutathione hydrolase [Skermanella mucosa]|uniref:hydroxyacylglutathione hydrolase n=1 Tax=Skermanella mucosa TaxID=1789672 RepID=UPI00192C0931|nr:hydroxyacylglutathione hydrolase [Skermanella mucosa]UEM23396.1 hydroxyacylglutathione hydrolase [Skermanella mucosa]